jgi:membrane peptidoglycan carboxypeptidase
MTFANPANETKSRISEALNMSSIHHLFKSIVTVSVSIVLIATPLSVTAFAGSKHRAKDQRPVHAQRRLTAKNSRAEMLRANSRSRRAFEEARHDAEVARLAAIARQREIEDRMRDGVQSMIARDDTAGEDPEVRRVAVNALGDHAGTVVVMDPKTGRVYAMVNQQWAMREGFKPCSTIKLVTGLAGLNEKVISPNETISISNAFHIDLTDALAHSNNAYFQQVGGRVGFDKMISYARRLGLGEKTGINVRNEIQGKVPSFKSGFAVNHMSSHGDDFKVTPIQLATLVSSMANGGTLLTPYISRSAQDDARTAPKVRRLVNLDASAWHSMVPGMVGSVNYGSGRKAYDPHATVVGKTGTCIDQGTWVGLFASYAPLSNPRLAVVVIARGADGRNHFPAAVAGRIYRDLNGRFGTPTNLQIAAMLNSTRLMEKSDPKAALNEEDKEIADADAAEAGAANDNQNTGASAPNKTKTRTQWGNSQAPPAGLVKKVLMPIPQRTQPPAKPATANQPVPKTTLGTAQRPRRVAGNQK